ncbi:MAG: hypothetical protein KDE04_24280 [Anaerolineales bacterium]|nr:hypothetical protein [Anaerolineales bacterium]
MTDFGGWVDITWPAAYNLVRYEFSKRQLQAEQEGEAEQQLLVWLVAFPSFFVNPERAAGPAARFLFLAIY